MTVAKKGVLFYYLYFLYIDNCRNLCVDRNILKFIDDVRITILFKVKGHETECGPVVEEFLQQSGEMCFCTVICPDQRKQPNYYP